MCCVVYTFFSIPTFQSITGFSDPSPKAHSFNSQKLKFKCFLAEYFPRKMKMTYMFCHLSLIFAINFHAYTTFVVLFLLEIITYQALAFEIICYLDCTYYNNHLQVESKMPMCNGIQRYMHCFLFLKNVSLLYLCISICSQHCLPLYRFNIGLINAYFENVSFEYMWLSGTKITLFRMYMYAVIFNKQWKSATYYCNSDNVSALYGNRVKSQRFIPSFKYERVIFHKSR